MIKSKEEIGILREGAKRLAGILAKIVAEVKPGVSTYALDVLAERLILECGARPAFKGYRIKETSVPYPASICTSVNDEIVHAIPRKNRVLKEGDIISLDIGMQYPVRGGLYTDMAVTIGVGKILPEAKRLMEATKKALDIGIQTARAGIRTGDIGYAIQKYLESEKLGIVRDLAGHGVGYELHEEPLIPNFGKAGTGPELEAGSVIAIEPMATLGGWEITLDRDEWTFRTRDGSLSAHFENTLVITDKGAEVLTKI